MAGSSAHRLPAHGVDADEVLARMDELRADDRDWRGGRVFSLVYSAGDDVHALLERAATPYSAENALNTMVFPSLGRMQQDIVTITAGLLGADRLGRPPDRRPRLPHLRRHRVVAAGHQDGPGLGPGRAGTAARPNMVLATSAHAAFEKASHYFDVESRRVPVRPDCRADVDAMADAVDDDTVLIVGSAPSYPQGVIDPIPDLAALAAERGILCHVDACLGGFILPFLAPLGHVDKPWDLTVPGVTSISADLHKYGYASKGVSVILYGDRSWPACSRSSPPTGWAASTARPRWPAPAPPVPSPPGGPSSTTSGDDGYLRLAADAHQAATSDGRHRRHARPGPAGTPDATVFAFGGDPDEAGSTPSPWATPWPTGADGSSTASRHRTACTPPCRPVTAPSSASCVPTSRRGPRAGETGARAEDRNTTYGTI